MKRLLSYSGIKTKVKSMDSKLISTDDYQKIAYFDSVADFILFLKNHPGYRDIFSQYDEHELHRSDAERIFINGLYLDYTKIYRFANASQRRNLDLIFFRYEVNILKSCIRLIYHTEDAYNLSIFHPFFNKHSKVNVAALAAAHSMDEYINYLKGTEYYSLLHKVQQRLQATSFDYEMELDIYYFKKTWKIIEKELKRTDRNVIKRRLGTEIDLLNIMWIYRAKRIYDMNSSDIYACIIPVNYKLSKELLLKLAGSASMEEFFSILNTSHYKTIIPSLADGTMERTSKDIISQIYKLNSIKYPASMASIHYYLYHKELEIARLTTALECIRYGLTPQEKLKYILQ